MDAKKKTDRRTLYTISAVKDAFLSLIARDPYDKVNVTAICREADVSRATFYLHFDNVDDVLDRVIDDALFSETARNTVLDLVDILNSEDPDALRKNEALLPACQRIADSQRYHALFMDPLISGHIIRRIAQHERDAVVPALMARGGLNEEEAEMLFRFILHGSFAVNRSLRWQKNDAWYRFQKLLARFVEGGLRSI